MSAAASSVSYGLGITHVDPIRHNVLFERFLNPGRHDPPDMEVGFPRDERPALLGWVFKHLALKVQIDGF
jgi:error-prone DNA polymerase